MCCITIVRDLNLDDEANNGRYERGSGQYEDCNDSKPTCYADTEALNLSLFISNGTIQSVGVKFILL